MWVLQNVFCNRTLVLSIAVNIFDTVPSMTRPSPLNCKNEYLILALGKETAVVGSIVWAFRRLNKPRSREVSARDYALHSVRPHRLFLSSFLQ